MTFACKNHCREFILRMNFKKKNLKNDIFTELMSFIDVLNYDE